MSKWLALKTGTWNAGMLEHRNRKAGTLEICIVDKREITNLVAVDNTQDAGRKCTLYLK